MWVRYLVFLGVVLVAVVVVLAALRAQSRLGAGATAVQPDPGARHEAALRAARQQLRKAERGHAKAVREAEKRLRKVGQDPVVVQVGPVALRPLTITVHGREHQLSRGTRFVVDVQGQVRSHTDAKGKVVRSDDREVFLTVEDPGWGDVAKLRAADLEGARRLVVAGEAATRNLDEAQQSHDERVALGQVELDRARADTAGVDAARMTLEDLEGAPPRPLDLPRPPEEDGDDEEPPAGCGRDDDR